MEKFLIRSCFKSLSEVISALHQSPDVLFRLLSSPLKRLPFSNYIQFKAVYCVAT